MMFHAIVLVAMIFGLVAQYFIPPLPGPWIEGARVLIMPVVMFYGALALPFWSMLVMAFVGGFLWDAMTLQIVTDDMGVQMVEISLGWSIVLYAALGAIMSGLRPLFRRGRWELHCLLSGLFTALIVVAEYCVLTFRRGDFQFPTIVWWRAAGSGVVAALIAPVVFFSLNWIAGLVGYETKPEAKGAK
jgi:hypothetical protein